MSKELYEYVRATEALARSRKERVYSDVAPWLARLLRLPRQIVADKEAREEVDRCWDKVSPDDRDWYDPLAIPIGGYDRATIYLPLPPADGWPDEVKPEVIERILSYLPTDD